MWDNDTQGKTRSSGSSVLVALLLTWVLVLGGYFRFIGLNWDEFTHFHPDERFLTGLISKLGGAQSFTLNANVEGYATIEEQQARCNARYPETNGVGTFFDVQCSIYNPHNVGEGWLAYGTLPIFIAKIGSDTATWLTSDTVWSSYEGIHLVWRYLNAASDVITILIVFFVGLTLRGKWVGLLAALFYACAPLAIQKSHFATTNAMTALFVAMSILFAARVQMKGRLLDYAIFGLMSAAAVSSRINTLPIVGVVILAAIVRILPAFDTKLAWSERRQVFLFHFSGLVLSGIVFLIAFRFFSPFAFMGPGVLGLRPNPRFFADIATSQYNVSGEAESPPNWQWVGRPSYLFPLWNMILWGLGIGSGLAGWLGWVWSGYQLVRGRAGATRNLILVGWVAGYFVVVGNLWVMSMRYYLPMYPALVVLAAWALVELVQRARQPEARLWRKAFASVSVVSVTGFSLLWGLMFSNIYREEFTVVQGSRWVWENVPGDFAMQLDDNPTAPLINIPIFNTNLWNPETDNKPLMQRSRLEEGVPVVQEFAATANGTVTNVYAPHLDDPLDDATPETLRITIAVAETGEELTAATYTANFTHENHAFGDAHFIPLDKPLTVQKGERYVITVQVYEGGPVTTAGAVMTWDGNWEEVVPAKVCALPDGMSLADRPTSAMVTARDCNGRSVWDGLLNGYKMEVFWEDNEAKRQLWTEVLDNTEYIFIGTNRRYDSQSRIPYRWPMTMAFYDALFSGELGFELVAQIDETFEFGPFRVSDQYLPTYNFPKWLNEFEAEEAFHVYDHPAVLIYRKTDQYSSAKMHDLLYSVPLNQPQEVLAYNCPSQPNNAYCDPTLIGVIPLYSLPADNAPTQFQLTPDMRQMQYNNGTWSSRFDTDSFINTQQVFTVIIWWLTIVIFGLAVWPILFAAFPALADRGYSVAKVAGVMVTAWLAWFMSSLRVPLWSQTGISMSLLAVAVLSLYVGWRVRADLINYLREHWRRLMWIEVLTLICFVFFLFIRLTNPDLWHPVKGGEKPMDFAYFNAVLRSTVFPPIDPWYAGGYLNYYYFGFVIVGAPTLLLGVMPSIAYNLIIPTLFAFTAMGAFFVAFNAVSAWHERRSSARQPDEPPSPRRMGNPWAAGITALLLCAVLGNLDTVRQFGIAVARLGGYETSQGLQDYLTQQYQQEHGFMPEGDALIEIVQRADANYWGDRISYEINNSLSIAGGLIRGMGALVGGAQLSMAPDRWYWGPSRVLAEAPGVQGNAITEMPFFTFLYGDLHAHMIDMPIMLFIIGFLLNELLLAGDDSRNRIAQFLALALGALALGVTRATNTWDWLTFLVLCGLGLTYIWWLRWQSSLRDTDKFVKSLLTLIGAAVFFVIVGVVIPSFSSEGTEPSALRTMLRIVALAIAGVFSLWALLNLGPVNRRSVMDYVIRVGGFVAMHFLMFYPFLAWYATTYATATVWQGGKTPLWAYFDIHGLFLFLIFSLLIWETARWLRTIQVRSLRGTWPLLVIGLSATLILMAGVLIAGAMNYQVALIVVPTAVWIAFLFFRPGQSRVMQFMLVLAGLAFSLTMAVEIVVLGYDIERQNTVFKFYIQAWLLFSVVGGAAFAWLIGSSPDWSNRLRGSWLAVGSILFVLAALYPIMATRGRAADRMGSETPLTLDGMDYMKYSQYGYEQGVYLEFVDDYNLIRWMQENIQGTPVIMEGRSAYEYLWGGRISINTGLPSPLGWRFHQTQQRTFEPMGQLINQRLNNMNAFYAITDIPQTWQMIRWYDISYIVVGGLERAYYPAEGLAKFDTMSQRGLLEVAYQNRATLLYKVNKDAINRVSASR
jgi:YYY domain-containing protein